MISFKEVMLVFLTLPLTFPLGELSHLPTPRFKVLEIQFQPEER